MKTNKLLIILTAVATVLFVSCVNPNEKLYRNLKEGPVDIEEAKIAIADGADVTQPWNSSCFLEMAAQQDRVLLVVRRKNGDTLWERQRIKPQLVRLFVEHGANPWEAKSGSGTFSLFDYAVENYDSDLLRICLDYKAVAPELAEAKTAAFVESVIDAVKNDRLSYSGIELKFCEAIWSSGLALSTKPKLDAAQKYVAEEKARLEKERQRLEKEREERARLERLERQRLEKERAERERIEAIKTAMREERDVLRARLQREIFPAEEKLSEEERSRGWTLLTEFGEAHMPRLMERCVTARRNQFEADANLDELVAALNEEGFDKDVNAAVLSLCAKEQKTLEQILPRLRDDIKPKINAIYQAAGNRLLDLAAEHWWLRYKLTDNYSAFKVGALTADELAAKDKELAELLK